MKQLQILQTDHQGIQVFESNYTDSTEERYNTQVLGCAVIRSSLDLTATEKLQARRKIMTYPLEQVRYRLQKEQVIPEPLIEEAMHEWRKFMTTILYANGSVGMISPIVDEVWHAFILFTKDYADFCHEIFGRFIHHAPNWPGGQPAGESGQHFRDVYTGLYGRLPAIWSARDQGNEGKLSLHHADCETEESNCESEGNCTSECKSDDLVNAESAI